MKKIMSLLLAALMALSVTACNQAEGTSGSSETAGNTSSAAVQADETVETEVLVLGGGGAGMTAALTASENGKKVVLLEKVGYLGGATMLSGGIVPAAGTQQQADAGIVDSVELFARDIFRPSSYAVRKDLVYTVADQADEVVTWLESLGVKMNLLTGFLYYGQSNYRMHQAEGSGKGITDVMIQRINEDENITVYLSTPAVGLIVEGDEVVGAYGETQDGKTIAFKAENTVLCTSGFAANKEMLEEYMPEVVNAYPYVAPGATGEGILWGQELGAAVANMKAYQGHGTYSEELGRSADLFILYRGGILVNTEGDRFTNEVMGYSELTPHVLAQPTGHVYMIFNQANADQTEAFASYEEAGVLMTGNTVEELAAAINVDVDALRYTFEEYQQGIVKGEDRFNRTMMPADFNGPYYALKITADLRHTQGGLVTDIAGHVLREDGTLIKGLYAAGGVTEGFSSVGGPGYMSGNGLLQAFVFGRAAGLAAATETRDTAAVVEWVDPTASANEPATPAEPVEEEAAEEVPAEPVAYADGEYEGTGKGQNEGIKVLVTVAEGKIASVVVTENNETPDIYKTAEQAVIEGIVANNGTAGVDTVSGATNSSKGIMAAVDDALSKAVAAQ